jgi:hypothetical protein
MVWQSGVRNVPETLCLRHKEMEDVFFLSHKCNSWHSYSVYGSYVHVLFSFTGCETCIRRNRTGPKIFSTLDKFPHYTKLQQKDVKPIKIILPTWCIPVYKSKSAALALISR